MNNIALAQKYGVSSIPFMVVFKNGEPVEQTVGVQPKGNIVAMVGKAPVIVFLLSSNWLVDETFYLSKRSRRSKRTFKEKTRCGGLLLKNPPPPPETFLTIDLEYFKAFCKIYFSYDGLNARKGL